MTPDAQVPGYADVRGWWDHPQPIHESLRTALQQFQQEKPGQISQPGANSDGNGLDILCLSGGGPGGAFGAGLLCGWTKAGGRPQFFLVTGISTGAMIAPFAFLGPEYDEVLQNFSARIRTRDIYRRRPLTAVLLGASSVADSSPLVRLLDEYVNDSVVAAVGREHAKGRRLFVGTSNLDSGQLVVWDMGAIAASGQPGAPALFRKVLLASSSIPIALPPQYFQVQAQGQTYDEMHVDGGVIAEMFLYGVALDAKTLWREVVPDDGPRPRLYVIRNGYLRSPPRVVRPGLLSVAERAVYGFLDTKASGDVYRLHVLAQRDHLDFHLAFIPESCIVDRKEPFDPEAMSCLFHLGYSRAEKGYPWHKTPPGLDPSEPSGPLFTKPPPPPDPDDTTDMLSSREPHNP